MVKTGWSAIEGLTRKTCATKGWNLMKEKLSIQTRTLLLHLPLRLPYVTSFYAEDELLEVT